MQDYLYYRTLYALASMVDQFCYRDEGKGDVLDSGALSALEHAFQPLTEHGYMVSWQDGRWFGRFTARGNALLHSPFGYEFFDDEHQPREIGQHET